MNKNHLMITVLFFFSWSCPSLRILPPSKASSLKSQDNVNLSLFSFLLFLASIHPSFLPQSFLLFFLFFFFFCVCIKKFLWYTVLGRIKFMFWEDWPTLGLRVSGTRRGGVHFKKQIGCCFLFSFFFWGGGLEGNVPQ